MFRVVTPPITRNTCNCNYSIWHWSNFGKCSVWSQLKMRGMDPSLLPSAFAEGRRDGSLSVSHKHFPDNLKDTIGTRPSPWTSYKTVHMQNINYPTNVCFPLRRIFFPLVCPEWERNNLFRFWKQTFSHYHIARIEYSHSRVSWKIATGSAIFSMFFLRKDSVCHGIDRNKIFLV